MGDGDAAAAADDVISLARTLTSPVGTEPTLQAIVEQAARLVPGRWAAALVADRITSRPAALAATTDEAVTDVVARIAGSAGTSPGWTAFESGVVCSVPDLATEQGFGEYPRGLLSQTGIRSVLSLPLVGRTGVVGVLTLYGDRAHAFGPDEQGRAEQLADVAGMALVSATADDRAINLRRALETNRTIGAAVGVLVERYRLSEDGAFDVLRTASQDTNRRLVELAEVLVTTGTLPQERSSLSHVLTRRTDRERPA